MRVWQGFLEVANWDWLGQTGSAVGLEGVLGHAAAAAFADGGLRPDVPAVVFIHCLGCSDMWSPYDGASLSQGRWVCGPNWASTSGAPISEPFKPRKSLSVPVVVIESLDRPMTVVGRTLSRKSGIRMRCRPGAVGRPHREPDMSDRIKAMNFERPEYIPVGVGILPSAWIKHREALDAIVRRYPAIFGQQNADRDYDAVGGTYVAGEHVDVWGCVWSNVHTGREAIVTGHPVPTRQAVHTLTMPTEDAGLPHGFMYLRLQDLRGFGELMIDFAEEPPELQQLIDIVLEYNLRQVRLRIAKARTAGAQPGKIVYFGDDLGTQKALPISPDAWRKYLKPCYRAIYGLARDAGFSVYMHSDGQIFPIIEDLIECGIKVINPQIRANGLDNLVATCKGKICVDLDLDR